MAEYTSNKPGFGQQITGKIIIQATVRNLTNLLIASGNDEHFDFEVILDSHGKPFIPGSSFAGMIRAFFEEHIDMDAPDISMHADYLWGSRDTSQKTGFQSHLIIDDLFLSSDIMVNTGFRDGVSINQTTAVADNKYDYEFVYPGASFKCRMELTIRKNCNVELLKKMLGFIIQAGKSEQYFQGAFTSQSFGQTQWEDTKVYAFDFANTKDNHADAWFAYLETAGVPGNSSSLFEHCRLSLTYKEKDLPELEVPSTVTFRTVFQLSSPLIIGSTLYPDTGATKKPIQKTHLVNEKNIPVVTAKSIRGAMRHRAIKIMNTLGIEETSLINPLFGFVDKTKAEGIVNGIKGKLRTQEAEINNSKKQAQTRIKICRMTASTIDGALLTDETLCSGEFELVFHIRDYKFQEVKLMLHILRDMITGDLPVGGGKTIGRGILAGKSLRVNEGDITRITWNEGEPVEITDDEWKTELSKAINA